MRNLFQEEDFPQNRKTNNAPSRLQIVSGDPRAGNVFQTPVAQTGV